MIGSCVTPCTVAFWTGITVLSTLATEMTSMPLPGLDVYQEPRAPSLPVRHPQFNASFASLFPLYKVTNILYVHQQALARQILTRLAVPLPATMPLPAIISSFMSVQPLEPVLAFRDGEEAAYFQSRCRQGRILPDQQSNWVFLPMPKGLLRIRTAMKGDISYDFDSATNARHFNDSIRGLGRIFHGNSHGANSDRRVYMGIPLK